MALFTSPEIALAGWIHYLAFDLLIGAWEVRVARREGIAYLLVLPCLLLVLLFHRRIIAGLTEGLVKG